MKNAIFYLFILTEAILAQGPPPGFGTMGGDGIWRRNAAFGEAQTFDYCLGHQPGNGTYHYHVNPVCLRAQLGDNLVAVKNSRVGTTYQEMTSGWKHSPILGWAQDGYPIYGPYGYTDPKNPNSTIKRIVSGYQLRSITTRTSLPTWSLPNHTGISQQLTSSQYGPPVSATYPLGRYLEDYDYIQGFGDLDQYNGRTTVTPDFPNGTYAYFVTIDANGNPAFPYVIAGQYYGTASAGSAQTVTGTVQDYFNNGVYTQSPAFTSASLASWVTANATHFAQIVSGFNPAAGAMTTWPGNVPSGAQTSGSVLTPTYAEIQQIRYSASSVYINTNGLPGYTSGPWFGFQNNGGVFPNFPSNQNLLYQFPVSPAPAATLTSTGGGTCGLWVNGVAVFNFIDGASYSNSNAADEGGGIVTPSVISVSAASFENGPAAPNSIVAAFPLFNPTIATSTSAATSANWPTTLSGATVSVKDSAGTSRAAQLSYASPSQLNYVVPAGTATGLATVTVTAGGSSVTGGLNVMATYPNLFSVGSSGLAAGYTLQPSSNAIGSLSQPVSAGSATNPVYLVIVGSGLGSATAATATIGGVNATVTYAGPEGTYPGVDQYNILIPPSLAGKGQVNVIVTAAGLPSNTVNITIQ